MSTHSKACCPSPLLYTTDSGITLGGAQYFAVTAQSDILLNIGDSLITKGILHGTVNGVLKQCDIPRTRDLPGTTQHDILGVLGSVLKDPTFGKAITGIVDTFLTIQPITTGPPGP